ncbi:efflux RND transporter periplasmic adaptor subunit [Microbulbifer pacificus]|uniref:Efflux RND transporter periplasmic adaptor subunit n=1 Tax=Microbulbifer pacificus TaxID=407164 RepID=A0AAU0N1Z2_9GAMM|nr:HlyD family efflux transporter periplasmic adaptor subunit [Microbulbifer pacificus]WOX05644.1 efflux RND transporter periplasmic adaptor subunit [Microbulbifer pacificus]
MKSIAIISLLMVFLMALFVGFSGNVQTSAATAAEDPQLPETGPHHGRLLRAGDFAVELAIVESGTPPEFRAWVSDKGTAVKPERVGLTLVLTRLGGTEESIGFTPREDYLRSDKSIGEPHSFVITVNARYQGKSHRWQYESFEGRTRIDSVIAASLGIKTAIAGPALMSETTNAYGRLVVDPEQTREVRARFDGAVDSVKVQLGERVRKGQPIIAINSNENLNTYTVNSPIDGVVLQRNANPGEQTAGRNLLVIANDDALLAELDVFPSTRGRIKAGNPVRMMMRGLRTPVAGVVRQLDPVIRPNQASTVRVSLKDAAPDLAAGAFVTAEIKVASYQVPLAVKRSALQNYRDFTVLYAQVGDEYEVRMLELGRESGEWVEVLGGLEPGTRYVIENSYIIKADIEKSGAAHEH